jgi:Secretion system C-terminal sorting domain
MVVVGSVTINGAAAPTGLAAISGGFGEPYVLTTVPDRALKVTGQIELVGGGFEDLASLRYGIFYSESAGTLTQDPTLDSNWVWTGTDGAHSGYLFVPPSGTNIASWSGTLGTWGAIANDTWWDINGSNNFPLGVPLQIPANALAGPGLYDFAISVSPQSIGNIVKTTLSKTGGTYYYEVSATYPVAATTNKFNYVAFAIDNSTTTALNLYDVQVDRGPHITTHINSEEPRPLPTVYSLNQNYPNPFNPATTIEFALPQSGDVNLAVYDISGRVVTQLAEGHFNAGYHKITFNAGNLASGIYLYRLEAGNFVSVKKLVLLK